MSTKTFKSFVSAGRFIEVKKNGDGTNLTIYKGPSRSNSYLGISVTPTDAPALALAILEAAGIVPAYHSDYQNGTPEALEHVAQGLKDEIDIAEAEAKEAADREALEREALELLNAVRASNGNAPVDSLDKIAGARDSYLTVARKAREMYKAKS